MEEPSVLFNLAFCFVKCWQLFWRSRDMRRSIFVMAAALMVTELAPACSADPIQWLGHPGANGHYYERVDVSPGIDWLTAKDLAETRIFLGVAGYLATITSEGENDFIADNLFDVGPTRELWLGGYQPDGSPEPDGNWQWITGEPWIYTNWAPQEPTNSNSPPLGHEDVLTIAWNLPGNEYHTRWVDAPHTDHYPSFVVEYVPVPGAFLLGMIGLSVAGVKLRKWA